MLRYIVIKVGFPISIDNSYLIKIWKHTWDEK